MQGVSFMFNKNNQTRRIHAYPLSDGDISLFALVYSHSIVCLHTPLVASKTRLYIFSGVGTERRVISENHTYMFCFSHNGRLVVSIASTDILKMSKPAHRRSIISPQIAEGNDLLICGTICFGFSRRIALCFGSSFIFTSEKIHQENLYSFALVIGHKIRGRPWLEELRSPRAR